MEYFDLYDEERNALGRTHRRGDVLPPGTYHIVVEVWTVNGRGSVLITRRDERKNPYPGLWENTGGAVLAGEESRQGALRELLEETGIRAEPGELTLLGSCRTGSVFVDTYLLLRNVALSELTLQPGETVDARWVTLPEIREMWERGELAFPSGARLRFLEEALAAGNAAP
jgi:8-oxo-dGTP pyrophosphatase MutT (NUDIX family)